MLGIYPSVMNLVKSMSEVKNGGVAGHLWRALIIMASLMIFMLGMFVQDLRDRSAIERAEDRWLKALLTTQEMFLDLHKETQTQFREHETQGAHDVADNRLDNLEKNSHTH